MNDQVGVVVLIGRLAVDDDELRAVALGHLGKAGRRIDDERAAEHDEQIAGQRLLLGAQHRHFRHRLTEGDRRGLHDPVTLLADRQLSLLEEGAADRRQLVPVAAIETGGIGRVAVQFDDLRVRHARALVQPVDVLGDDGAHPPLLDQLGQRAMTGIGLGLQHGLVGGELAVPGLAAHLVGSHEVVEVDRLVAGPDAPGRAEVRDSRLGRDARAGEGHDPLGRMDHLAQAFGVIHRHPP